MDTIQAIPSYSKYEVRNGEIVKAGTSDKMTVVDGKVQVRDDKGGRGKKTVEFMLSIAKSPNLVKVDKKKSGMSDKIRQAYKDGSTRKQIAETIMSNRGYVDNVIYRMNFKENEKKIIEDSKVMASEDVCKKYDISARFIPDSV